MKIDKSLLAGSLTTLVLKLLEEKDMYGYEMIDTLKKKSDSSFDLKAGTLYPILHKLEQQEMLESYEQKADKERTRKYYHLTDKGGKLLQEKKEEWKSYSDAVNLVLDGGVCFG